MSPDDDNVMMSMKAMTIARKEMTMKQDGDNAKEVYDKDEG